MSEKLADTTVAHQVLLSVRNLDCLSTLPCVAARVFGELMEAESASPELLAIIESDPAFTIQVFSLVHEHKLMPPTERISIRRAVGKVPKELMRDTAFSVKPAGLGEIDSRIDKGPSRKQLLLHSLAVACCAEDIAKITLAQVDTQLAYSAGLLHDLGKLALQQAMPKSFERIVEQAESQNLGTIAVEQSHLGLDHTIIGRRLAEKWHLPEVIALAIWLHHSDTVAISQTVPAATMAQVVQLADMIARQCGIGGSGSFDDVAGIENIAESLQIIPEQIDHIREALPEKVAQKSGLLGLNSPTPQTDYCQALAAAAGALARKDTRLTKEVRELQIVDSHFNFAKEFLFSIGSDVSTIDIAEDFAVRWQKFYQTGMVLLYLAPPEAKSLEAVLVENLSQSRPLYINVPAQVSPVPEAIGNSFAILDAHDHVPWLFEQLDAEFDPNQTKIMPLLSDKGAIGAIIFEVRYPQDIEQFEEKFQSTASFGAAALDMASRAASERGFAEHFAQLLSVSTKSPQPTAAKGGEPAEQSEAVDGLDRFAEMAGGAAHELNNPLSIVSGRAQLLAEAETDPNKKSTLTQIQENAAEATGIVDSLMMFAEPQRPRPVSVTVKQLLDEASQLTAQRFDAEELDIRIDVAKEVESAFVDSAQIASAMSNILSNALESYGDETGTVEVTAEPDDSGDLIRIRVTDFGCGMDTETVRKATYPFFSVKAAGRKRGMGLAHAQRLVQLNKGSLAISSKLDSGTTVTVLLPKPV